MPVAVLFAGKRPATVADRIGLVVAPTTVERPDAVCGGRRQSSQHVVAFDLQMRGDLVDRRRSTVALREFLGGVAHEQMKFLGPSRHAHGPRPVTEVALQLSFDRAPCERREGCPVLRIESVDRLDQSDHRDLPQIVVAAALSAEPVRDVRSETHVPFDELIAEFDGFSMRRTRETVRDRPGRPPWTCRSSFSCSVRSASASTTLAASEANFTRLTRGPVDHVLVHDRLQDACRQVVEFDVDLAALGGDRDRNTGRSDFERCNDAIVRGGGGVDERRHDLADRQPEDRRSRRWRTPHLRRATQRRCAASR
jgi:hypothetical protein